MSGRTASCPNCGAEIVFRWSGAIQTTCPACRSILVRHDIALEKVGMVADVPQSMSGIQLGTEGQFKKKSFTVVGRIIYRHDQGHWNEWHIRFGDGRSGWLSDAQAEFAVSFARPNTLREGATDRLGDEVEIEGQTFTVGAITEAAYAGVEGELPFEYWDKGTIRFVDLRGPDDAFATVDWSETPPLLFVGEHEESGDLRLRNLRDVEPARAPTPRGFNCSSCGAAITLRTGEIAQSVACGACGSILDARDENHRVLQQHTQKLEHVRPAIPLGTVGHFKGKRWTVIGFQVRSIRVDGELYSWREFLLWNQEAGFRYLTEYDGHWNDVAVVKGTPRAVKGGKHPEVEYLGTRFKHFQHAQAATQVVLGEFPWEVRVGDMATTDDYVAPPLMLSREETANEITWSLGTYTSPAVIQEAFKLENKLRRPVGVFANEPNPSAAGPAGLGKLFVVFAAALFLLFIGRNVMARNEKVFENTYRFSPATGDTSAFVTRVFELKGRASNVELRIVTDLANDWAFFNVALLPVTGNRGFEVAREISKYSGYDGGESWSEGSVSDRVIIPSVPAGQYYLRVEVEHQGTTAVTYLMTLRRDVPRFWPFLIALLLLSAPPVFALIARSGFETSRWAESDYAPEEE